MQNIWVSSFHVVAFTFLRWPLPWLHIFFSFFSFFFDTRNIHQSRRFGCLCVYERGREMGQQHEERNESRMFDFIFFVLFYLFPFRTRLHPWRPRAFPFTQTCRWDILFPQFFVCLGFSSFSLSTTRNSYNTKSPIVFLFIFSLLFRTTWKYQGLYWKRRGREKDTSGIGDSFFRSLYSFVFLFRYPPMRPLVVSRNTRWDQSPPYSFLFEMKVMQLWFHSQSLSFS